MLNSTRKGREKIADWARERCRVEERQGWGVWGPWEWPVTGGHPARGLASSRAPTIRLLVPVFLAASLSTGVGRRNNGKQKHNQAETSKKKTRQNKKKDTKIKKKKKKKNAKKS